MEMQGMFSLALAVMDFTGMKFHLHLINYIHAFWTAFQ